MKTLSFVTLSLLAISLLFLDEEQNKKLQMYEDTKVIKKAIRMDFDAKSMKEEILKQVPIGSSIYDAKHTLEENCFGCEMYKNGSFTEKRWEDPKGLGRGNVSHYNEDFLSCRKHETPYLYVMEEWMVIIVHHNDVVSDVFVNTGLTGP